MKSYLYLAILLIILIPVNGSLFAQGCSDAGVCSFGAHAPEPLSPRSSVGLQLGSGLADEGVLINFAALQTRVYLMDELALTARLPYQMASGNGFSVAGIGDPFIGAEYLYALGDEESTDQLALLIGARLALGESNATDPDAPNTALPMQYQPGLGTNDLIVRVTYSNIDWSLALGFQMPDGQNENSFLKEGTMVERSAFYDFENFTSSRFLERGPDLSLRFDYFWQLEDIRLSAGVLPIFRLWESEYTALRYDPTDNTYNSVEEIEGTAGLTFNITGGLAYELTEDIRLDANLGFPIMTREKRPDGLTRAFQLNLGVNYLFGV